MMRKTKCTRKHDTTENRTINLDMLKRNYQNGSTKYKMEWETQY